LIGNGCDAANRQNKKSRSAQDVSFVIHFSAQLTVLLYVQCYKVWTGI
jgi:hypothetical protein